MYSFARYVAGKFTGTILQRADTIGEAAGILSEKYGGVFLYICTVEENASPKFEAGERGG